MKNSYFKFVSGAALAVAFSLASCHSVYDVTKVEGRMQPIDSVYDVNPDAEAVALLAPYKAKIDSMMYRVVGTAEMSMDRGVPESLLSNLVADVLRGAAVQVLGKPADMGLVNIGGLRNVLTEGPVTCGNIYEILPFENSLCVVTLKGTDLNHLFENIAACGGEGVAGGAGAGAERWPEGSGVNGQTRGPQKGTRLSDAVAPLQERCADAGVYYGALERGGVSPFWRGAVVFGGDGGADEFPLQPLGADEPGGGIRLDVVRNADCGGDAAPERLLGGLDGWVLGGGVSE